MSATLNSTSSTGTPVIIRVPVIPFSGTRMSVKEAEEILRAQGFRPATAAERRRNREFLPSAK